MDQDKLIRSLKMQLRTERISFGVLLFIFIIRWGFVSLQARPYAILADGNPVAYVATEKAAEDVLSKIKSSVPNAKPSEVSFEQNVEVSRASSGVKVSSGDDALKAAKGKLSLRLMKYAIMVGGKPAAAVDSEDDARAVIATAKQKFGSMVDNLMEEPGFKQDVRVQRTAVDPAIYRSSPDAALEVVLSPGAAASGGGKVYNVASGDVAGKIASDSGLKLSELKALNPDLNLDKLQIGDKINISAGEAKPGSAKSHLVVVVRNQVTRTEAIPYQTETVSSVQLFTGKQTQLSPGKNGQRRIVVADTYENGVKTGSEVMDEQILSNPVARRVAVGIRTR